MQSVTLESRQQTEKRENTLLHNVFFLFFVSGICTQLIGNLIPFLRAEYGFDYDTAGILLSAQSIGNLIAVLLSGVLPLYMGRRRSVLLTAIWMLVAYIIFAGALRPVAMVILAFGMIGFSRGGAAIFTNTMVSTLPDSKATFGYNLLHGNYAVGALLAPILLLGCIALFADVGWRVLSVLVVLITAVQVGVYMRMDLPDEPARSNLKGADMSFFANREFWIGTALLFCYISTEYAIIGWLVTYFQDIGILSDAVSQLMNSIFWGMMFVGRLIIGKHGSHIERTKLLLVDGIGLLIFFFLMFFSRIPTLIIIGLMGVGLFMATIYPTAFALGSVSIKGNDMGCSMMNLIASIGGIVTPALVGFVAEKAGIQAGMACVLGAAVLMMGMILVSFWSHRSIAKR